MREGRFTRETLNAYVIGPGSGINLVLIAIATGLTTFWTSGKNPLEVANTRAVARMMGWTLHAKIHDNILSPEDHYAFPGLHFDIVEWNTPILTLFPGRTDPGAPTLIDLWDGSFGLDELKRFALGLSHVLTQDRPLAIAWSSWVRSRVHNRDFMAEAMTQAGLFIEESYHYALNSDIESPDHVYAITRRAA